MEICGICGNNHCSMDCDIVQIVSHIPDKVIPSKAKLTLPEDLLLRKMADDSYSIVATYAIGKGTQYGPLQAKKLCSLLPTISFPLRVFYETEDDFSEYYLDTSDENECNWMMFINPANDFQEQNVVCYQDGEDIYYVTVKDISEGEALKVWYSPYYATKMKKDVLKPVMREENEHLKNIECIDELVRKKKNITSREIWSCKFCGKMERILSEFALHLLKHYRTKLGRYCQICNSSFMKAQGYQKHMKIVHERDVTNVRSLQSESKLNIKKTNLIDPVPKENYFGGPLLMNELLSDSMDNAGLILPQIDLTGIENQNNLFEHENLNLNVESILPESVKVMDNFNFELVENENEQFVCDICLKVFRKLKQLIVHMNIHTGKYACFECKKVFARQENLNHHHCNLFYKFECPHCSKLFFQKKYLGLHIKKYHTEQDNVQDSSSCETFSCPQCFKTFTHKNNLIIHSRIHQPREKYTCPICNKSLVSQKTYIKHYKLHEGNVNKCEICEKVFSRKDTLKYHIDYVHSAKMEICPICNKAIKSKKLLQVHMKSHKENSFRCSQCPTTFKQQHNLNRHVKNTHEKNKGIQSFLSNIDKQFSCPKCDKKLKVSRSLKKHLETMHPEEKFDYKTLKLNKTIYNRQTNFSKQVEDSVMDLKQTIENMNYSTDEINHEITTEIDKLLNNPENFGSESNDRLVESLINTAVGETNLDSKIQQKDPMLSMPTLDIDDGIN